MDNDENILNKSKIEISNVSAIDNVQFVINFIEEHLLEEITPKIIAEHFFLSISSISTLFKVVCDMPIMQCVKNRRLTLAGMELLTSTIHIIDLAFKYGYETPEAFTKAFTRFHGFPPSLVRRTYPKLKMFNPLQVKLEIHGGWELSQSKQQISSLTKHSSYRQEDDLFIWYDKTTKMKGCLSMENKKYDYRIHLKEMKQQEDWKTLLSLARNLDHEGIKFKVDGNTMIFVHGLEFKLEKICLTFKWSEEKKILDFFECGGRAKETFKGFKYFDTYFKGMKIRCMFYGDYLGDDTDELLYQNTDLIDVDGQSIYAQTLEFYHENSEPEDEYYQMVDAWLKNKSYKR